LGKWRTRLVDGWKAAFGSGIRFKELLIELAWLPKQDSAGAVYSFCNLCKKKIADRSAAHMMNRWTTQETKIQLQVFEG